MKRLITTGIVGVITMATAVAIFVGLSGPSTVQAPLPSNVADVEPRLPMESFAYFSIDGVNNVTPGQANVADVEPRLPMESFAYFSIDGINGVTPGQA